MMTGLFMRCQQRLELGQRLVCAAAFEGEIREQQISVAENEPGLLNAYTNTYTND